MLHLSRGKSHGDGLWLRMVILYVLLICCCCSNFCIFICVFGYLCWEVCVFEEWMTWLVLLFSAFSSVCVCMCMPVNISVFVFVCVRVCLCSFLCLCVLCRKVDPDIHFHHIIITGGDYCLLLLAAANWAWGPLNGCCDSNYPLLRASTDAIPRPFVICRHAACGERANLAAVLCKAEWRVMSFECALNAFAMHFWWWKGTINMQADPS